MSTPRTLTSFICHSCRQRLVAPTRRTFRTSALLLADSKPASSVDSALASLDALGNSIANNPSRRNNNARGSNSAPNYLGIIDGANSNTNDDLNSILTSAASGNMNAIAPEKPHRLHVYSTKHNTHLTLVQPPRSAAQTTTSSVSSTTASAADAKKMIDVLMSVSAGNLGFRKAGRGSYDAAYQLAAFTFKQIQERGMLGGIHRLEVVLRGFGAGREAVTKALLGSEGRYLRGRVVGVVDATRLKLGGPRSKKPRRLG
ncbi:hypothetical protein LTR62_002076 [Meristemomyces frigidus]|uniref:Small ribosomal subunit protein uS11m n=1 Tax=Meristemomyces frigidus TaxID=1508187 RepID=A0AAN7YSE8_9PEZI|nr:hypothetical protein LTR62_002076 [Meristemomyces frigidus]